MLLNTNSIIRFCCRRITGFKPTRKYGKMTKLYRPAASIPPLLKSHQPDSSAKKDSLSKSQKLMLDNGIIQHSNTSGTYHLLTIGTKSLDKLIRVIDRFMEKADCQKIHMPVLASSRLWATSGRLDKFGPELMTVKDRHDHELVLCPTHEEVICDLLSVQPLSHRCLPLKLYQITEKFRDEKRPRFGLLRGREFLMKDLYTFDADEKSAEITYHEINNIYADLLNYIGVQFVKVKGASGLMGGSLSHEFHLLSKVGEDKIITCDECQFGLNQETLIADENMELNERAVVGGASVTSKIPKDERKCPECGSSNLTISNAIEVAHSFLLGTKYTEPFQTSFRAGDMSSSALLHMGCYGIGVTRLLASVIEVLSTQEEIRWPLPIAPYLVALIPPKAGSKEEQSPGMELADKLNKFLIDFLPHDLLVDDRTDLTIGKRLKDMKKLGIPYAIVCGKNLVDEFPNVELIDIYNNSNTLLSSRDVFRHLYDLKSSWTFL